MNFLNDLQDDGFPRFIFQIDNDEIEVLKKGTGARMGVYNVPLKYPDHYVIGQNKKIVLQELQNYDPWDFDYEIYPDGFVRLEDTNIFICKFFPNKQQLLDLGKSFTVKLPLTV